MKDGTITVEALDRRQTFTDVEALAEFVGEVIEYRGGIFDSLELACVQELARQNGSSRPEVERIARQTAFFEPTRPKIDTPLDDRVRDAEAKEAEAEAARLEANEVWRSAERELEVEGVRRMARADTTTKEANVQRWEEARIAHVHAAEADFRIADDAARRTRARLNALRLSVDRWRYDQEARFFHPAAPEPLTLEEFRQMRGLE